MEVSSSVSAYLRVHQLLTLAVLVGTVRSRSISMALSRRHVLLALAVSSCLVVLAMSQDAAAKPADANAAATTAEPAKYHDKKDKDYKHDDYDKHDKHEHKVRSRTVHHSSSLAVETILCDQAAKAPAAMHLDNSTYRQSYTKHACSLRSYARGPHVQLSPGGHRAAQQHPRSQTQHSSELYHVLRVEIVF